MGRSDISFGRAGAWMTALAAAGVMAGSPAWAQGGGGRTSAAEPGRVIVAWRDGADAVRRLPLAAHSGAALRLSLQQRADALAVTAGRPLAAGRALGPRTQVVRAEGVDSATLASRLVQRPDVAWAVPDLRRRPLLVPADPLYAALPRERGPDAGQWTLQPPDATIRSGTDAQTAWNRTRGDASVVVAVLDTGVLTAHPDFAGQLLPGIDTIDDPAVANDGDAEDGDASDPGDWITAAENDAGPFSGCGVSPSSWHGSQVASIVAARADDGVGMSGAAPHARILPVRVMGKCGGYDSDIIAGMRWAAGLQTVAGIANANPAKVINLSLGSSGGCTQAYRDVMTEMTAAGVTVVAAAGNSAGQAVGTPANCPDVIAVAGLRHAGSKVGFSDLGAEITISAPGGNCVNIGAGDACLYPIVAATNHGTRAPLAESMGWTDSYDITVGTSFASPIVAGAVALMLSVRPDLTPGERRALLRASARPFPTTGADNGPSDPTPVPVCRAPDGSEQLQCYCTTGLCGAGMLDAASAVGAAAGLVTNMTVQPASPQAGADVALDASASTAGSGRSIVAYQWSLVDGGGIVTGFVGATNASSATARPTAAGAFSVRVAVTDDLGAQRSLERRIEVAAAPTQPPTPAPPPVSGGGGGAVGVGWLLGLAAAVAALRRPRARA